MANTIKNTALVNNSYRKVIYLTLVSDGTEETDYTLYDSSVLATAAGAIDPLNCRIMSIQGCLSILDSTAVDVSVYLEWDASTDVSAFNLPIGRPFKFDFSKFGGLTNQGAAGKTGDINLNTTGLESGDRLWLEIEVAV